MDRSAGLKDRSLSWPTFNDGTTSVNPRPKAEKETIIMYSNNGPRKLERENQKIAVGVWLFGPESGSITA